MTPLTIARQLATHKTRVTCGNIYDSLWVAKHIYTDNRNTVYPIYVPLYSLRFFNSIHNTQINLLRVTVVHLSRRSRSFPSVLAAKDKSTSTRLTRSTSFLSTQSFGARQWK